MAASLPWRLLSPLSGNQPAQRLSWAVLRWLHPKPVPGPGWPMPGTGTDTGPVHVTGASPPVAGGLAWNVAALCTRVKGLADKTDEAGFYNP